MAKTSPGKSKTDARSVAIAERRQEALRLRRAHFCFREIGERLGVSPAQAYEDVARELRNIPKEEADILRALESQDLEELERRAWIVLEGGEIPCPHCKKPVPLPADLAALGPILKVKERRARMLGLDKAPEVWSVDEVRVIVKQIGICILQVVTNEQQRHKIAEKLGELDWRA